MGFVRFSMRNALNPLVFHWFSVGFWILPKKNIGFSRRVLFNRGWPPMLIIGRDQAKVVAIVFLNVGVDSFGVFVHMNLTHPLVNIQKAIENSWFNYPFIAWWIFPYIVMSTFTRPGNIGIYPIPQLGDNPLIGMIVPLLGGELPTNRKWVSSPQWLTWDFCRVHPLRNHWGELPHLLLTKWFLSGLTLQKSHL